MVHIPLENVKVKPTRVYVDLDTYGDENLPNVSCLPSGSTNEAVTIQTFAVDGENALCVHSEGEKFSGVLGAGYDNCITESGLLYAMDRNTGAIRSPAVSPEGKRRMAELIAQVYDCYVLQSNPDPASAYLWHNDGALDRGLWSALFSDSLPPWGTTAFIYADIDRSGAFEPTVGIVTAADNMTDDFAVVEVNVAGVCAIFHSELPAPYGTDGQAVPVRVCLTNDGYLAGDDPTAMFDERAMLVNLGNVLNAFDFPGTAVAHSIVAGANGFHVPESNVPEGEQIEEEGWIAKFHKAFLEDRARAAKACIDSHGMACTPW